MLKWRMGTMTSYIWINPHIVCRASDMICCLYTASMYRTRYCLSAKTRHFWHWQVSNVTVVSVWEWWADGREGCWKCVVGRGEIIKRRDEKIMEVNVEKWGPYFIPRWHWWFCMTSRSGYILIISICKKTYLLGSIYLSNVTLLISVTCNLLFKTMSNVANNYKWNINYSWCKLLKFINLYLCIYITHIVL